MPSGQPSARRSARLAMSQHIEDGNLASVGPLQNPARTGEGTIADNRDESPSSSVDSGSPSRADSGFDALSDGSEMFAAAQGEINQYAQVRII